MSAWWCSGSLSAPRSRGPWFEPRSGQDIYTGFLACKIRPVHQAAIGTGSPTLAMISRDGCCDGLHMLCMNVIALTHTCVSKSTHQARALPVKWLSQACKCHSFMVKKFSIGQKFSK